MKDKTCLKCLNNEEDICGFLSKYANKLPPWIETLLHDQSFIEEKYATVDCAETCPCFMTVEPIPITTDKHVVKISMEELIGTNASKEKIADFKERIRKAHCLNAWAQAISDNKLAPVISR